jgi:ABC-type sugar transport system ATPase subunit
MTTVDSPSAVTAARLEGVRKTFPGVVALDHVSFDVARGEIHGLIGENGAGKSTLVKILAGIEQPDDGRIVLDGEDVVLRSPRDARLKGVSLIPQEVLAVPRLSVGRNIMLGLEDVWTRRDGLTRKEVELVEKALERSHANIRMSAPAETLSVPELRMAQIAKTLLNPGDVLVLDEPTAVLSEADAEALLARLVALKEQGKAIVYVTHRLSELLQIAQRLTVLRDGRSVGTFLREEINKERIVELMAKPDRRVDVEAVSVPRAAPVSPPVLHVAGLTRRPDLDCVSLDVAPGQIVGLAGVQASGHGHLLRAVAGLDPYDEGEVTVGGRKVPPHSVPAAYRTGVVLVPADRRQSAIVPAMSVQSNLMLPARAAARRFGFRRLRAEREAARGYVDRFGVRTPSTDALAGGLSGGNVLLLDEPTQGIDVNAKAEIRLLVQRLAAERELAVVVATSEFEELIGLADVVHVMCLGRLVATIPGDEATYAGILHHALP